MGLSGIHSTSTLNEELENSEVESKILIWNPHLMFNSTLVLVAMLLTH